MNQKVIPLTSETSLWSKIKKSTNKSDLNSNFSDFGFAALDIIGAYAEDSGRYTLKAKNALGNAESHIDVKVSCKYFFFIPNTFSPPFKIDEKNLCRL